MLLLAARSAGGTPVSLNHALPGIDRRNANLVVRAVAMPPDSQIHIKKRTDGNKTVSSEKQEFACGQVCTSGSWQ